MGSLARLRKIRAGLSALYAEFAEVKYPDSLKGIEPYYDAVNQGFHDLGSKVDNLLSATPDRSHNDEGELI